MKSKFLVSQRLAAGTNRGGANGRTLAVKYGVGRALRGVRSLILVVAAATTMAISQAKAIT